MPKFEVEASELLGTHVERVSLVKKGANRVPFRIMKQGEKDMLDLHAIARNALKSSSLAAPLILAAVVTKASNNFDLYQQVITEAGLSVSKAEEKDGLVFFAQDGVAEENPQFMKINDEFGLVISGLKKGFESWDWQSTSLKDMFATEGFFPSMWLGLDLLGATFGNIMQKAENPADAKDQLIKACDEFRSWLESLAGAIPEHAFKAEQLLKGQDWEEEEEEKDGKKVKSKKGKKKADIKKEDVSAAPVFGNLTDTSQVAPNGEQNIDGNPTHGNEAPNASGGKQPNPGPTDNNVEGSPVAGATSSSDTGLPAGVKKEGEEEAGGTEKPSTNDVLLNSLSKLITDQLAAQAQKTEAAIKTVADKIGEVETNLKKMDEAVNGTIHNSTTEDRHNGGSRKMKASADVEAIDTGLRPLRG